MMISARAWLPSYDRAWLRGDLAAGITLAAYLLPGAAEVPEPRVDHMETPSPYTQFGVKGIGEGGAIAPPAAITNAINDALRPLGAELAHSPVTPRRIVEAVLAARARPAAAAVTP